jgi:indoleamine 2,3-dioxygenase
MNSYTDGFFSIDSENGFLPIKPPLKVLPEKYINLQKIIDNLSTIIKNENEIILHINNLENYIDQVKVETDIFVIQALYRAYSFITSAYLLEKSYHEFLKTGNYGKARNVLPKQVSIPYNFVANKLDSKMWLDYHYAYSLGNYVKKDDEGSLDWKNLDMACCFSGGPDEVGFIMIHVYINELSPKLVESVFKIINSKDVLEINEGLLMNQKVMKEINKRRREMWQASRHDHYNDFRVFIMGVKGNNDIFGDGILYEGVFDEPVAYRGQTGAQDDIIPTEDILSGVINYYPNNELTKYLYELREYRPVCVQNFFEELKKNVSNYGEMGLVSHLINTDNYKGLELLCDVIEEIYHFRNGHWQFVQKYIMANTKYAVATGGTPITTWLINQIEACIKIQNDIIIYLKCKDYDKDIVSELEKRLTNKVELIQSQVKELTNEDYNVKLVYDLNLKLNLSDEKSFI